MIEATEKLSFLIGIEMLVYRTSDGTLFRFNSSEQDIYVESTLQRIVIVPTYAINHILFKC
jgi:hypothetical protein